MFIKKYLPCALISALTLMMSGCDNSIDKTLLKQLQEKQVEQQNKIDTLTKQQITLVNHTKTIATAVSNLDKNQKFLTYTELDPSKTRFFILNNGSVAMAGRVESISPTSDGSVINISLVNLLSVPVANIGFNTAWGTEKPADAKELARWRKLLFSTSINSSLELTPGKWTNIDLTLKGVSPNNLKYLRMGINMEKITFTETVKTSSSAKKTPKK